MAKSKHLGDLCWRTNERLEVKRLKKVRLPLARSITYNTCGVTEDLQAWKKRVGKKNSKRQKYIEIEEASKKEIRKEYTGEGNYLLISNISILETWKFLFEVFIYLMLIETIINSQFVPVSHIPTFPSWSSWIKKYFLKNEKIIIYFSFLNRPWCVFRIARHPVYTDMSWI